jgi:hypothetical protein
MAGYNASLEVYYCKQSESPGSSHRIAPAPQISISPEIYYANDNVIGYTYNITLNGYANALRKEINAGSTAYGLSGVIDHMGDLREIFNTNGGNLYVKQGSNELLVAKGATIKNIQFNESDNRWVNYSPFTIELEFNEIDLKGCDNNATIACSSSIFHQIANTKNISNNLIDIQQYKIKEFTDKWTFTIDDQIYNSYDDTYNNTFRVSYNISATGKNYYINDNLVPAWQQARLFVQDRLYKQVFSLINGQLQIEGSNDNACNATKDLSQIHSTDNIAPRTGGLLQNFSTPRDIAPTYDVYNEQITCDTSESDGSFSVTYEAILKKYNSSISPVGNAAIHTFTKNITVNTEQNVDATISVQGTIQGLVRGGFIYHNNDFNLPQNGTFITTIDSVETKYSNALDYYTTQVGSGTDLSDSIKQKLNIKKSQLLIKGTDGYPRVSNFTIDHNYHTGSITYNATYDRSLVLSLEKGFTNISITRQDPVDIIQEFIIPGRIQGPIIQKLNMKTARTVSVNIEGASPANKTCNITDICSMIPYFSIKNFEQVLSESNSWIKTREDYTTNAMDGSYSISLEYTLRQC